MEIREKVLLKEWTFWKIGGAADFFCLPESIEEVQEALHLAKTRQLPLTILGGGTNVLVSDQGVEGLVVCMKKLTSVKVVDHSGRVHIVADAGAPKSELTKAFLRRKLAPALFLCGVPGDIGGGIVMNAGVADAFVPREFVEIVDWVEVLELGGKLHRFSRTDLEWKYRHTSGWQPGVIIRAGISWALEPDDDIPRKVKDATRIRVQRQPLELPSCGSTFKNPPNGKAGALIEQAGLKGYQRGGAQVSLKHANFIVNIARATALDVMHIINHVQSEVRKQFSVELETEVKLVGRW